MEHEEKIDVAIKSETPSLMPENSSEDKLVKEEESCSEVAKKKPKERGGGKKQENKKKVSDIISDALQRRHAIVFVIT